MNKNHIKEQSRKFNTINENQIINVSLSLATSKDVKEWSNGEVKKPETINYKSFKPERMGLFDELIFGPQVDFKCPICSTKYKRSNEGQVCEKTDECKIFQPTILPSSSKRTRMGHIELASPVVHFWFMQVDHSILSKLLGLRTEGVKKTHSRIDIQNVVYFKSHIVLESGKLLSLSKNEIININKAPIIYRNALREIIANYKKGSDAYEEIDMAIKDLEAIAHSKIGKDYGIDFYELNDIIHEYSNAKIGTGSKAIEYLLENFDIKAEAKNVKTQITKINKELESGKSATTKFQQRSKLYKRLEVLNGFIKSNQDLKSILIYNLPVIPADLRPLIQIDGGRHSTTDVNELYRRIIIRNNRLKQWQELDAPVLIIQNELRMLQEAVDALIDNSRKKPSPILSKNNRPLKSIADSLSGKKGRFRQNLLGKRVDYSGRSVIVVGPDLKMHQAGIPRVMAAKLFEPWIIRELIKSEKAPSIKFAKKMVEEQDKQIWPYVEKAIKGKVVLLNRAPTLHRLSIQAFEPVLIRGKAIRLHPLVTSAFNADFDGDQMAVHVPISKKAILEARELMLANKNILGPKDGEPIINPSQDMILGIYYLTKEKASAKREGMTFRNYDELVKALDRKIVSLHSRVAMPINALNKQYLIGKEGYVISTVGKFIFNNSFPANFPFIFDNSEETINKNYNKHIIKPGTNIVEHIKSMTINKPLGKKHIARVVRAVFDEYVAVVSKEDISKIIANLDGLNVNKVFEQVSKLIDNKGKTIAKTHVQLLEKFITETFEKINKSIKLKNNNVERALEIEEKIELLEKIWFKYTNVVANSLDNIKELGFKYSMISGITMSISDIKRSPKTQKYIKDGNQYVSKLKSMFESGIVTDDERYRLVIDKWTNIKKNVQEDLKVLANDDIDNSIFTMMDSGARGNISNFVQLAGLRGLMSNNKKNRKALTKNNIIVRSTIEVPVKSSFLNGLTAYEFYSTTPGARKGLTDTALNTANAGYLTRRLVDVAQNIVVRELDCGTGKGFVVKDIIDTKTKTVIAPLIERIEGRFSAVPIKDLNDNLIVDTNELINKDKAKKIVNAKIMEVEIRSVLGCQTDNGVCKICYGKDLATNDLVQIGEPVGIVAAQSIGEPGTQLTMRTFHTGGVAGVEDITGGFDRLKQLIDAIKDPWEKPAIISESYGKVKSITASEKNNMSIVTIISSDKNQTECSYEYDTSRRLRVKKGEKVIPGKKLVEGPIKLDNLLEIAGITAVQNYLLKEIQRLYRMQGISIADKYIEIIIRQMFSKILIQTTGDSKFFAGSLVGFNEFTKENTKLLAKDKKPAFGNVVIKGAKQIPLLSDSFLAAASYQETAKVLVHSSLSGRVDDLSGLKENIILGRKIPAGTFSNYEINGKYDIKNPRSFFTK